MSTFQVCLLGVVLAWAPSLIFLACIFHGGHRRSSKANQKSQGGTEIALQAQPSALRRESGSERLAPQPRPSRTVVTSSDPSGRMRPQELCVRLRQVYPGGPIVRTQHQHLSVVIRRHVRPVISLSSIPANAAVNQ
jgi:hypothetical protein